MTRPFFPLHRPHFAPDLKAGQERLGALLGERRIEVRARRSIVAADRDEALIYRIASGWCARLRYLRDGRAQLIALLLPGDLVAVEALFLTEQLDEVIAITDVRLEACAHDRVAKAMRSDPALMLRLSWQMIEDNRRRGNWLVALSRGSAEERLALLLLDLRGRMVLSGLLAADADRMPWHITQNETAQALGLTSVHVNRTWRKFRERGLAHFGRHEVELDVAGLHAIAIQMLDTFERGHGAFGATISAPGLRPAPAQDFVR